MAVTLVEKPVIQVRRNIPNPTSDLMLRAPVFVIEASEPGMLTDGPMVIDLDPKVLPEDQWIIEDVSAMAACARKPSTDDWMPPVSGIFLCPPATPVETNNAASFDLNLRSRPVPIPLDPYTAFRDIVSTSGGSVAVGAIGFTGNSGFQVSVPGGWFLRFLLVLTPGGAPTDPTGPGIESYGKLTAMVRVLRNLDLFQGD